MSITPKISAASQPQCDALVRHRGGPAAHIGYQKATVRSRMHPRFLSPPRESQGADAEVFLRPQHFMSRRTFNGADYRLSRLTTLPPNDGAEPQRYAGGPRRFSGLCWRRRGLSTDHRAQVCKSRGSRLGTYGSPSRHDRIRKNCTRTQCAHRRSARVGFFGRHLRPHDAPARTCASFSAGAQVALAPDWRLGAVLRVQYDGKFAQNTQLKTSWKSLRPRALR